MTGLATTILIVDDELANRRLLEALLRPEGYLTVSADDGEKALAAVARSPPDLILLDAMMPGINGYEVAKKLKSDPASSNIPIIMVTAQSDRSARLAGLDSGAEEFLTKPVDRAELWLRVRNLLRLKAYTDFLQNHSLILEQEVQARTVELQRFRTAMDASADAIFLVSRSTQRFVEVNATACSMFGYSRDELLAIGPVQLGAGPAEQLEAAYDALIAGRNTQHVPDLELRTRNGLPVQVELHRHAQLVGSEWIFVDVLRDLTDRKQAQTRLDRLAHYDALTGLPNRKLFFKTLQTALAQAANRGWRVALLSIDLDHFKNVNDVLGQESGDELLLQIGNRLSGCVHLRDTIGRLGGDEFALIHLMVEGHQEAARVVNQLRDVLRAPFYINGRELTMTASIGIAMYPDDSEDAVDGSDPASLLRCADAAMNRAKLAGRDGFSFYTAQMNAEVSARMELETALIRAIDSDEFVLHYQPKVQIEGGHVVGVEALLRWERPGHGLVQPSVFIPVLEQTGLIVRVGSWVIATAARQIGLWLRSTVGPVQVSVNVASRQFSHGDPEGDVIKALGDNDFPAELLELELTESALMENTSRTIACLRNLKQLGVQISIDDFGTGYSSLAYLSSFPIDKLKIDIAFIRDITHNPGHATIALAIIQLAKSLGLKVIAEGVETEEQLAYLRLHGCDQVQGFYFSRALAVPELERFLLA